MQILITAGPTHEPIDAVRYIGNRSSGAMGAALAQAARDAGHTPTLILGPVTAAMPPDARRIDVETAEQMRQAVMAELPGHDLLIMAAAVSDYRPATVRADKIIRGGMMSLKLESTPDILAEAGQAKRADQRTVGFSLVARGDLPRSIEKLHRKKCDLLVYNPIETMNSATIEAVLLYPDGRKEVLGMLGKPEFARILIERATGLF